MTAESLPIVAVGLQGSMRLPILERRLADLGIALTDVVGVDGRRFSADELRDIADANAGALLYGAPLTPTQVGCVLSHRVAYRRLLESDAPWALILEDDAFPVDALASLIQCVSTWTVDYPTIVEIFSQGHVNSSKMRHCLPDGTELEGLRTYPAGTVGYFINSSAATLALTYPDRVASRADWPPWVTGVQFWRTKTNAVLHGDPAGEPSSTMMPILQNSGTLARGLRWFGLVSTWTYWRLRPYYPRGLRQFYQHAIKPPLLHRLRRLSLGTQRAG